MKHVKPGRGPSFMSGVMSIFMGLFGIVWTVLAASLGAPGLFQAFGLLFIGVAVVNGVYSFLNAGKQNRYSAFDITDSKEEPDPLHERFGPKDEEELPAQPVTSARAYCPYCGAETMAEYEYCRTCGKKLPE